MEPNAIQIYQAIKEMQLRDYSESEIINGIEMLLRNRALIIV